MLGVLLLLLLVAQQLFRERLPKSCGTAAASLVPQGPSSLFTSSLSTLVLLLTVRVPGRQRSGGSPHCGCTEGKHPPEGAPGSAGGSFPGSNAFDPLGVPGNRTGTPLRALGRAGISFFYVLFTGALILHLFVNQWIEVASITSRDFSPNK